MTRELDVRVVEVMGYFVEVFNDILLYATNEETYRRYLKDNCLGGDTLGGSYAFCRRLPSYSEDMTAARAMEDWLDERCLQGGYAHAMLEMLQVPVFSPGDKDENAWALLRATPEQRCRGFLKAMGK